MKASLQPQPLKTFDPGEAIHPARSTGLRRDFAKVECAPLRWPTMPRERFDIFDAWHDVAMQILHQEKVGLRLMAIAKKVVRWSDGAIVGSNGYLASRAGYCAEKTISREVAAYTDLGLFICDLDWKRPGGGKFITVRTLRPSLPLVLPTGTILPEGTHLSLDNSGPDLGAVSLDNSGPGGRDNSGPATIDHKKGGPDAA